MSLTIQGTYKNGTVSLDRLPEGVREARVVVEFAEQPPEPSSRRRGIVYFGMFTPPNGQFTTDEEIERVKKSLNVKLDE